MAEWLLTKHGKGSTFWHSWHINKMSNISFSLVPFILIGRDAANSIRHYTPFPHWNSIVVDGWYLMFSGGIGCHVLPPKFTIQWISLKRVNNHAQQQHYDQTCRLCKSRDTQIIWSRWPQQLWTIFCPSDVVTSPHSTTWIVAISINDRVELFCKWWMGRIDGPSR